MLPRFFCPDTLGPGATVALPDAAAHHAAKVLRLAPGDDIILFNGQGGAWQATLHSVGKTVRATLGAFDAEDREPPLAVTLVQSLPASDKMDFVVQKCVELGVARIQPVAARRSLLKLSGERKQRRVEHWRGIAIAACEQSGRNRVPDVADILDLSQYLALAATQNETKLVCAPGATSRLGDFPPSEHRISLLIGPEGGFEEGELAAAHAAGFQLAGLGPRVLRTETAGPAAMAALMSLWGDW